MEVKTKIKHLKLLCLQGIKIHTNPEQVEQLMRTLYRPHNLYCIHVDRGADEQVSRQTDRQTDRQTEVQS
jgi:hypothetical protein